MRCAVLELNSILKVADLGHDLVIKVSDLGLNLDIGTTDLGLDSLMRAAHSERDFDHQTC